MLKNHRTSFRTEVESFVHQDARYARNCKQRANFKWNTWNWLETNTKNAYITKEGV